MKIQFPAVAGRDLVNPPSVAFVAEVDGLPIECRVTSEALTHFGMGALAEPLAYFDRNRSEIKSIARAVIERDGIGEGVVTIVLADMKTPWMS